MVEHHIKNSTIRHYALNSPHIIDQINARQLIWLGKIAKMNVNEIPRKMLVCWTSNKRKPGRPQLIARNYFTELIKRTSFQTYIKIVNFRHGSFFSSEKLMVKQSSK